MNTRTTLLMLAAIAGMAANAANYYVGAGETRTVSVGGGLSGDNISHRVYVEDGGTVKLSNPPGSGEATLYNYIICSNGTVTVDATACAGANAVRLAHGVRALGELKIVGVSEIRFGRQSARGASNLSVFDCPKVTFYAADGTTPISNGKVVFDAAATLVQLPQNNRETSYEIASGIEIALAGNCVFGDLDVYELGDFETIILDSGAFRTGALLKVRNGRTLAIKPCRISEDLLWYGKTGNITNNVELGGVEARLSLRAQSELTFCGNVSGSGKIGDEFIDTIATTVVFEGDLSLKGAIEATHADYSMIFKGGSFEGAEVTVRAVDGANVSLFPNSGSCTIRGIGKNVMVKAEAEAMVNAGILPEGATLAAAGGKFNLELDLLGWTNDVEVALWLDPNDAKSVQVLKDPSGNVQSYEGCNVVEKWWDCRLSEPGARYAYNNRAYLNGSWQGGWLAYVYPRLVAAGGDGPNGLAYLYTSTTISGSAGRLYLFDEELKTCGGTQDSAANSAQFTIMVFGSKFGGGTAMIGGIGAPFLRAGDGTTATKDTGILKDDKHPVWLDGERIADPTTTGFSGGWQVVSLQNGSTAPLFLGWRNEEKDYAGAQQYGEIIFLKDIPSDEVRARIEYYLAVKWGLAAQLKSKTESATLKITALGEGDIAVTDGTALELTGDFTGTLELNGASMSVVNSRAIPGVEEIPSEGQVAWFDPNCAETLMLASSPEKPRLICGIYDRVPARRRGDGRLLYITEPDAVSASKGDRCPYLAESNWLDANAPVRCWIDNNNYYDGDTLGNALRLRRTDNRTGSDADGALTVRTIVLVQNSMRGGGTPVLGKYAGETGVTRKTGNPATALWNQDAPEALKNAAVYVNGSRVENPLGNSGFGGRSEVLSIETAGDYSVSAFGFYGNSENAAQGEVFGEILLYSKVLATAQREDIEAYLQRKYLGTIKSGYCALRSLDVNGADKVRVPDFSTLPRVSAGEVTVNGEVLNFTVVGGASSQVVNGVDLGKSSLLLPSAKTVAVRFNGKPSYGVYTLVSAGSISVGDLELETAGKTGTARFELRRSGSAIQLAVMAGGMMMTIR